MLTASWRAATVALPVWWPKANYPSVQVSVIQTTLSLSASVCTHITRFVNMWRPEVDVTCLPPILFTLSFEPRVLTGL